MLKLILMGMGLAAILFFLLWNQWNAARYRMNESRKGERALRGLEGYAEAPVKIKEAERERKKTFAVSIGVTVLAVFVMVLYIIIAKHFFINHHDHIYDVTILTKEPTCSENGILQHKCRYCDEKNEEPIKMIAHHYEQIDCQNPTCTQEGKKTFRCKTCGETRTESIPLADHQYEETSRTESTCVERGKIVTTCKTCGETKTELMSLADHQYEETSRTESTCVKPGKVVTTCKVCGETKTEEIPLVDHQYGETDRTEPTCTEEGVIVYTCEVCKDVKTEAIPVTEHAYVEAEKTEQTCSKCGWITFRCQHCNHEKKKIIPADGKHQYVANSFNTANRTAIYVCDRCGTTHEEFISVEEESSFWTKFKTYNERENVEVREAEPNKETGIATPVENFSKIIGNLKNEKDVDCYSFTVSCKSNVEFLFSHDGDRIYSYYWYATIYDTDGETILNEGNIAHKDKGEIVMFGASKLEPGTYYLKISPARGGKRGFTDATYYITLHFSCVSHDLEKGYLLKAPTCTEDGECVNVCSECGECVSTEVMSALGHEWAEWHNTKNGSIVSRGQRERVCIRCGTAEQEVFLHPTSVIAMIVAAVIVIVVLIVCIKCGKLGLGIGIGVIAVILCFYLFFVKRKPNAGAQQAQATLIGMKPVSIVSAEATSEYKSKGNIYKIESSYDGDVNTSWQDGIKEGEMADGTGQTLTYYFDEPKYIVAMDVVNGKAKNKNKYYDNNRMEEITINYLREGQVVTKIRIHLDDVYEKEAVQYNLTDGTKDDKFFCDGMQIVIESVYAGKKYNDLCLSEICFYEGIFE